MKRKEEKDKRYADAIEQYLKERGLGTLSGLRREGPEDVEPVLIRRAEPVWRRTIAFRAGIEHFGYPFRRALTIVSLDQPAPDPNSPPSCKGEEGWTISGISIEE